MSGENRSEWPRAGELVVETLGPARRPSPVDARSEPFVEDSDRVLLASSLEDLQASLAAGEVPPSFEPAGPRREIFFNPRSIACGILTCGGLCPGLNNVVRSIVLRLTYAYGVRRILGFRFGYAGLAADSAHEPMVLTPDVVEPLQRHGGTMLGSSRGPQDIGGMVDTLIANGIGILFVAGGDGGLRGAAAIHEEIRRRSLPIAVVGIPKTIDNDLLWTWRSFGFATAVEASQMAIQAAHTEARGAWHGVGLVKLMGRHSGYIAAHATLASSDVNFCLVPEVPFTPRGTGGFLEVLESRLETKHHAVVVVAEGAGQDLLADPANAQRDASGNVKLADVGIFLRDEIARHFAERGKEVTIRYIDPSYMIRSLPAGAMDALYCLVLGQHAVHAAMAGKTNVIVGSWNNRFVHVPIPLAISARRVLEPAGEEWQRVLEATGQPASMVGR